MPYDPALLALAERVISQADRAGLKVATAESCTGGLLAGCMTEIAGSSSVFDYGLVTYSNEAKQDLLGVSAQTIAEHGAVSAKTALAMVQGLMRNPRVDIAFSITGVAGPGGGSADKPVGLVFFGYARKLISGAWISGVREHRFEGDRHAIRIASVRYTLSGMINLIAGQKPEA